MLSPSDHVVRCLVCVLCQIFERVFVFVFVFVIILVFVRRRVVTVGL